MNLDATERFSEHDLRVKCASDPKSLEHARAMRPCEAFRRQRKPVAASSSMRL